MTLLEVHGAESTATDAGRDTVMAMQPAERPRLRGRAGMGKVGPPLIVFVLFLAVWTLSSYLLFTPDRRFLLPPPNDVVNVAFLNGDNLAEMLAGLWLTAKVAMLGLGIAIGIGLAAAVLMSQAAWLERSLIPYAIVLQTVPILALVPLLGFWFGDGFFCRVVVCVIIALFPVINNTLFGLLSADRGMHDLFSLHGGSRWTRLLKLQVPAALPTIFSGLRIAAGLSVIGAVVGDFFFRQGDPGIGSLLSLYQSRLQSEQLFGAIILSCSLGIIAYFAFGLLSTLTVGSWYKPARAGRGD